MAIDLKQNWKEFADRALRGRKVCEELFMGIEDMEQNEQDKVMQGSKLPLVVWEGKM